MEEHAKLSRKLAIVSGEECTDKKDDWTEICKNAYQHIESASLYNSKIGCRLVKKIIQSNAGRNCMDSTHVIIL